MAIFAEIIKGVVTNVIVAADGSAQDTWMLLPKGSPVSIGWEVVNGTLQPPAAEPVQEELPAATFGEPPSADTMTNFSGTLLDDIPITPEEA